MDIEENGMQLWQAREYVPAGIYLRVDDHSYRAIVLEQPGPLPASYDGHIAHYCQAPAMCLLKTPSEKSHASATSEPHNQKRSLIF